MGAWRRQAFGIFHVTSQYLVDVWVISADQFSKVGRVN